MAVSDKENQWIVADQPIVKRVDDRLSRCGYSQELAGAIAGWSGNTSLTIALYGAWGSGKSSVKNMAVEYLREGLKPLPAIIEFNPWRWTTSDDLADAFFREVGRGLGQGDGAADAQKLSKLWKKYSASFSLAAAAVSALPKLVGDILIAAGLLALFGYALAIPQEARAVGGLLVSVAPLLAGILLRVGTVSETLAKYFEAKSAALESSLEERRSALEKELKDRRSPVVVIIDDIDRLPAERIALMLQLIKAMADLPNFVYLMLFQRDIVEKSLNRVANDDGAGFLEKIVQIGLDLPQISRAELETILSDGLNAILAETVSPTFDTTRWGNLYVGGLNAYFRSIRDVKRYLAALQFHIPLFRRDSTLEVNVVDLFAVEVLRLFEPRVYQAFRMSKDLLTSGRTDQRGDEFRKAALEQIVVDASGGRRKELQEILVRLFPQIAWAFGGMERHAQAHEQWLKELRICSPDIYDKYLLFSVPQNDISQAELDVLVSASGDRRRFLEQMRALHKRGLIVTTLERLDVNRERVARKDSIPFLTALFDFGDDLSDRETPGAFVGPETYLSGLVHRYLRTIDDPQQRLDAITAAICETNGLFQPVLLVNRHKDEKRRTENPGEMVVAENHTDTLVALCLEKIHSASKNGTLYKNRHLATLLYRWLQWEGSEAVRKWVANLCISPEGAIIFLDALTHRGYRHVTGDSVGRVTTTVSLTELEKFVEVEALEAQISQVRVSDRTEDERAAIGEFEKALRRRREGKPETDRSDDDGG